MRLKEADHHQMADQIRRLGLEESFPDVHHFSDDKFATRPGTLKSFCVYCDGVGEFDEAGENPQTIRRAVAFAEHIQRGTSRGEALAAAWQSYPLVTR